MQFEALAASVDQNKLYQLPDSTEPESDQLLAILKKYSQRDTSLKHFVQIAKTVSFEVKYANLLISEFSNVQQFDTFVQTLRFVDLKNIL